MEAFITEEMKNYEEKLREYHQRHRHHGNLGNFQVVSDVQRRQQELILKVTSLETILLSLPKFFKEIVE